MTTRTNVTVSQALSMLAATAMRPFTKNDWYAFSGCEDPNPTIGEFQDYTLVQDGAALLVLQSGDEYGGQPFTLSADAH